MPRRSILSAAERNSLLEISATQDDLIRRYAFDERDLSIIRQHRRPENRLGFAVHLCYMRFPGVILGAEEMPSTPLLRLVADQIDVPMEAWESYAQRAETRREHLLELQAAFGFTTFTTTHHYRSAIENLDDLAWQTDKGIVLASALVERLRQQKVLLPAPEVIDRICAESITRANRRIYAALTDVLTASHRQRLDALLQRKEDSQKTELAWLREAPAKPNSRHMRRHIERLQALQAIELPAGMELLVHQNRLLKLAREGGQMTPADLARFETQRRYATLAALVIEATATVTDEIIDLHDRILGKLFNAAKQKHQEQFQRSGKAINDKIRLYGRIGDALLEARKSGTDPFAAIESVLPWEDFTTSVTEAKTLARPADFDFLHHVGDSYTTVRLYAAPFLAVLKLRAAPAAQDLLDAIEVIRDLYDSNGRKMPADAPTRFIKPRWKKLVITSEGLDRHFYELCALSELKNALRSGDIWVQGSRQFKDFDTYLIPAGRFDDLTQAGALPLAVNTDCEAYLQERMALLEQQLASAHQLAAADDLPDAIITDSGLKITPLDAVAPDAAQALINQAAALLPHIKITEVLMEVDAWTGFTRHFTHLKNGDEARDKTLLLTAILADGINLGLSKMAESSPGMTYAKLSWLQAWHIRDETYL